MKFSGSKALSDAWGIFTGRFGPMLAIVAIYIAVSIGLLLVFGASLMTMFAGALMGKSDPSAVPGSGAFVSIFVFYVVIYAVQFAEQAALCRLCSDRHTPNIGDALMTGIRSILTLFGVLILGLVGIIACSIVFGIVGGIVGAALMSGESGGSVAGLILVLFFVVAGIWLVSRLALILPVVAIDEERNPIAAITKAWRMTSGSALKIALLFILVSASLGVVFGGLFFAFIGTPAPGNIPDFSSLGIMAVIMMALGAFAGNYIVALVAAIYRQLAPTGTDAISQAFA